MLTSDLKIIGELEEHTLAAAASPGDIVQTADGLAAVVVGVNPGAAQWASGDKVSVCTRGFVTVTKASGTTIAAGARAGWDATNKLAVSTSGDYALGAAFKTISTTKIRVRLNQMKVT